jgi:gliding motility-associated-like protein
VQATFDNTPNIYTVTITDGCTIPGAETQFTVNVNPLPTASFSSTPRKGCAPWNVSFQAISDNPGTDNYSWDFGDAGEPNGNNPTQSIYYPTPGSYTVGLVVTNQFGCKSDTIYPNYVEVWPVPIANFDAFPQLVTLLDPTVSFTNTSIGAVNYFWDFGDYSSKSNNTTIAHPSHTYEYIGKYPVNMVAINEFGCKDTLMKWIEVWNDVAVYVPNTFTPDGNGLNDEFKPKGYGIKEEPYKMEIFDRWGELLYTSENFHKGWNGTVKGTTTIAEEGVYIYKLNVTDLDGNKKYYVGHVNLLKK